jgi:Protein of unknown function (DUF4238)
VADPERRPEREFEWLTPSGENNIRSKNKTFVTKLLKKNLFNGIFKNYQNEEIIKYINYQGGREISESRKHHYVPQSILRNFKIANETKSRVWIFDKSNDKIYPNHVSNIGCENHFNTFTDDDNQKINFESIYNDNDGLLANITTNIIENNSLEKLSDLDKKQLSEIVSIQMIRTKMYRSSIASIHNQMADWLNDMGFDPQNVANFSIPSDNDIRKISCKNTFNVDKIAQLLTKKVLLLLKCNYDEPFWISDNPVVKQNNLPYGDLSLDSFGIQIYFPISKNLSLAYFCPTIIKRFKHDATHNSKSPYCKILDNISNQTPVDFGPGTAVMLNALQVAYSLRFLYSSNDEFSFAKEILQKKPQLCNNKSMVSLGGLGNHQKMPDGNWVVILLEHDHFMIPVENIEIGKGFDYSFETKEYTLKHLLENTPIKEIQLYTNEGARSSKRAQLKITEIDSGLKISVWGQPLIF